jgi:hypothetical protein
MYFRRKTSAGRAYLQIVESRRDGTQVHQQVIAALGRFEQLHQRWPDPTDRNLDRGLIAGRAQHHGFGGKPRTRAHQPLQLAARPAARSEPLTNSRCSTVRNTARSSAKPCLRLPASSVMTVRQPVSSHSRSNARPRRLGQATCTECGATSNYYTSLRRS